MRNPSYRHAQGIWALWLAMAVAFCSLLFASGAARHDLPIVPEITFAAVLVPSLTLAIFGRLVVSLDSQFLQWQFGYFGLPRWKVSLAEIASVEVIRTRWWQGWGIHRTREGWLYNASGLDAIRITLRNGNRILLGSDESKRLASFIEARLPDQR